MGCKIKGLYPGSVVIVGRVADVVMRGGMMYMYDDDDDQLDMVSATYLASLALYVYDCKCI